MKQYLLSIYQPDGAVPPPEVLEPIMADLAVLRRDLQEAGAFIFTNGLHASSTATVVRVKDGEELITDGPYLEGKEHLGGLMIVQSEDLDGALRWGRRLAQATTLPIEVRPFQGE